MTVEELLIKIKTDTTGLSNKAEDAKKSLKSITDEAEKVHKKLNLLGRLNWGGNNKTVNKYQREIEKTVKKIENLKKEINSLGDGAKAPTPAFKSLAKDLEQAKKKANEANDAVERMIAAGKDAGLSDRDATNAAMQDKSWGESEKAYARLADLQKRIKSLKASGGAFQNSKEFISLNRQLSTANEKLRELRRLKAEALKSALTSGVKRFGTQSVKSFGQAGASMRKGIMTLLRYSLGIRGLFILFNRLRSAVKEGFGNLSQFSGRTSSDLAMLRGSLTQVKNSLATAFAPILTVIAPIIQTFVNLITTACNALAMFFGALTGQKTVTVAKSGLGDIAAGAGSAADATGAANGAAEEYQRTLMGFDQINKLDDNSGSGGGGGGAGGVGGGAGFSTAEISNAASGWADKVKEAWKNADFTEIGATIASKINSAMDKINWASIKEKCNKVAKSIGTFINGFVGELDWGKVGYTLSQGFITVFDMLRTFLSTVDWAQIGRSVVQFVAGIDWKGLFSSAFGLLGSIAGGFAALISGAISEAWAGVKAYFMPYLNKDGVSIVDGIFWGIVDGIKNIGSWIKENIFQPFIDGFKKAFGISSPSKEMKKMGGYLIDGLLQGLKNNKITKFFSSLVKSIGKFFKKPAGSIKVAIDKGVDKAKTLYDSFKNKTTTTSLKGNPTQSINNLWYSWYVPFKDKTATTSLAGNRTQSIYSLWYDWYVYFKDKTATIGLDATISSKAKDAYQILKEANNTSRTVAIALTQADGGVYKNGSWKPVTMAAGGGAFSMGQMFVAREAGPELVGTIGGSTAVMNNDQIVASVSAGVARAVASVLGSAGNGKTTVVLEGDARNLFRVVRTEAQNYTNATGLSPFPV